MFYEVIFKDAFMMKLLMHVVDTEWDYNNVLPNLLHAAIGQRKYINRYMHSSEESPPRTLCFGILPGCKEGGAVAS